ncbi:sulfatase [bacterium]|nr:sulfatase [bacterium]
MNTDSTADDRISVAVASPAPTRAERVAFALWRFFNVSLMTVAVFGALGLATGLLNVWPYDYLSRDLDAVFYASLKAPIGAALRHGALAGFWNALLVLCSRALGGRYRARLAAVAAIIVPIVVFIAILRTIVAAQGALVAVRFMLRWGSLPQILRSIVWLGQEDDPFARIAARVTIVGLIALATLFAAWYVARRARGPAAPVPSKRPSRVVTSLAFLTVAGFGFFLGAPARTPVPGSPDIVLVSIDTLRADRLSIYGNERKTSPNIDRLAREGVMFEQAIAHAPWTLPSHASMFTGLLPYEHGAVEPDRPLPPDMRVFPERLLQRGYRTGAFVTGILVSRRFGFDRGFDTFRFRDRRLAADTAIDAMHWFLASRQPSFLFLHLFDMHYPYHPPPEYYTRFGPASPMLVSPQSVDFGAFLNYANEHPHWVAKVALDRYDETLAYVDDVLGRLFKKLRDERRWDNTLIIVTSDHGEEFYDHGSWGHSQYLYEESLRVPLIVKLPRGACGPARLAGKAAPLTAIADLILKTANGPSKDNPMLDCRAGGVAAAIDDMIDMSPILAETQFAWELKARGTHRFAARSPGAKLIEPYEPPDPALEFYRRGWEYYDLADDPLERLNLYAPGAAPELESALADANKSLMETERAHDIELDPATIERLRSLGYLQ